jgi:hypothetical protein
MPSVSSSVTSQNIENVGNIRHPTKVWIPHGAIGLLFFTKLSLRVNGIQSFGYSLLRSGFVSP